MSDHQVTGNRKFRVGKSQCRGEHMGHYVGHGTAHAAQRSAPTVQVRQPMKRIQV